MFYLIDRDKSGVIDCEELGQYLRTSDFDDYFISVRIHRGEYCIYTKHLYYQYIAF